MASRSANSDQPQASAQGEQIRAFLDGLFRHLCTGPAQSGLLQQPCVLATIVRLIGDFSLWFGAIGGDDVPLTGALQLLLQALPVAQVGRSSCSETDHVATGMPIDMSLRYLEKSISCSAAEQMSGCAKMDHRWLEHILC